MTVKQVFNTSADLDYPNVLPTLDLDFANNKTLDPRITFTRSSGGSYVGPDGLIKYAGVNEARFDHNPITGESLGLLIEEARTNSLTYSEDLSNVAYFLSGLNPIATNTAVAPDGTLTADSIIENTLSGEHIIYQPVTVTSLQTYTASIFIKANQRFSARIAYIVGGIGGVFADANLSTGTIGTTIAFGGGTVGSSSIQSLPNGWFRISVSGSGPAGTTGELRVELLNNSGNRTYTGDGSSGIYLWGAQLEQGTFPTSYIPTVASTRTRAAEQARITGKNFNSFYNPTEGTILCNARILKVNTPAGKLIWSLGEQLNFFKTNYMPAGANSPSITNAVFNTNLLLEFTLGQPSDNILFKTSSSYKLNDYASTFNGSNYQVATNNATVATFSSGVLAIGSESWTFSSLLQLNGTISRLTYYPKRLPQSQLLSLTA